MNVLDYVVLVVYFLVMTGIGVWSMLLVKKQEDFFLGSRSFGKLFQAFAAFGAGTGSHDPVTVGRTTFTSGLSGIWAVLLWLFVTPFYWFTAVWYRRMRHITLGDWFVERYQSKGLGAAFTLFALAFYMVYLALGFTAIGKVGAPLVGVEKVSLLGYEVPIEHVLVYICAVVVLVYGVLGGLRAAYWTDVIQGFFIIALSVLLIPAGLSALVAKEAAQPGAAPAAAGAMEGFRIMHQQVPREYFEIIESPRGGEFPIYYIVAITLLNLVAIVVHPHMAVTGGGSAKTENSARVGLVVGNFLKRFCTIGWCITILIVLAYMPGNVEIARDPDRVWGIAARELLGPYNLGLVGLMLACLMAALMSSASAYMLVVSALVVRNVYAAYVNENAAEKTYVLLGRVVSGLVLVGGVVVSLAYMDVFEQLKVAWEMPILFAALFWIGMFWRRATRWAAWGTVLFSLSAFFLVPWLLPKFMTTLADDPRYAVANDLVTTTVTRNVVQADVGRRDAAIELWNEQAKAWAQERAAAPRIGRRPQPIKLGQDLPDEFDPSRQRKATKEHVEDRRAALVLWERLFDEWRQQQIRPIEMTAEVRRAAAETLGPCPTRLKLAEQMEDKFVTGGKAIFWTGGVVPVDSQGRVIKYDKQGKVTGIVVKGEDGKDKVVPVEVQRYLLEEIDRTESGDTATVRRRFRSDCDLRGKGRFRIDFLIYDVLRLDLTKMTNAALETLRLPTRVVLPFVVMVLLSLVTPRVDKQPLDRFYAKMKTPVQGDPQADRQEIELSNADPRRFDDRRLVDFGGLEFQRPKPVDVIGFVVCFAICFLLIWGTVWLAKLGS